MPTYDWERFDRKADLLESRLHALLQCEPYASDDRRLARVYLAIANAFGASFKPGLRDELDRVLELNGMSLGQRALEGRSSSQPASLDEKGERFFVKIIESAARPMCTIDPDSDTLPIAHAIALGMSFDEMEGILAAEYPQLPHG